MTGLYHRLQACTRNTGYVAGIHSGIIAHGMFEFEISATDGRARAGVLHTPHGALNTPLFAPVGTQAAVKAVTPAQLVEVGTSLVLANTYHLYLRPGHNVVRDLGGLHAFMNWHGPILTDSGGYQVFSLGESNSIDDDGVTFRSHIDGSTHRFTPEHAMEIQEDLGADIIMAFDQCPAPYERETNEIAMARTHAWAERCKAAHQRRNQALFGIVQGGAFSDLRAESARFIAALNLPGNAIGGLSVGESKDDLLAMTELVTDILPAVKPRYLMGVGSPDYLVHGVARGVDMFDCVLPTRLARHAAAMTRGGQLNMKNAAYAVDRQPVQPGCGCYCCANFSRAYIRHLCMARETMGAILLTMHNLTLLHELVAEMRAAIIKGEFGAWQREFAHNWPL